MFQCMFDTLKEHTDWLIKPTMNNKINHELRANSLVCACVVREVVKYRENAIKKTNRTFFSLWACTSCSHYKKRIAKSIPFRNISVIVFDIESVERKRESNNDSVTHH